MEELATSSVSGPRDLCAESAPRSPETGLGQWAGWWLLTTARWPLLPRGYCWCSWVPVVWVGWGQSAGAALWVNAGETVFVHDIWWESWTCSIYFFGCLGFWSHPRLMTERGQLCSSLDWSPFVRNHFHIFEYFFSLLLPTGKQQWKLFIWKGYRLPFHPRRHSLWISVVCFTPCASASSWRYKFTQGLAEAADRMLTLECLDWLTD